MYYVPDIVVNALHVLSHLILTIILWCRYLYYSHFTFIITIVYHFSDKVTGRHLQSQFLTQAVWLQTLILYYTVYFLRD